MHEKSYHQAARSCNRRPLNEDGSTPTCLQCGRPARKYEDRHRWFATCGDKNCSETLRLEKMIATKSSPEYQPRLVLAANRAVATMKANYVGDKTILQLKTEKIQAANSRVGKDGLTGYERAARKAAPKVRATNEKKGNWSPIGSRESFDEYRRQVTIAQRKFSKQIRLLPHYDRRGPSGKDGAYHLDHKISLWFGYTHGICPNAIAHICNLEMKPWVDNNRKWSKCDISFQQLQKAIENYEKEINLDDQRALSSKL